MQPVEVSVNPLLFTAPSGQRYAVAGSVWLPVPEVTTRADLDRYMVWTPPQANLTQSSREWSVTGSKGATYRVTERDGQWVCSCPGYGYRRKCRHIEETKNASR